MKFIFTTLLVVTITHSIYGQKKVQIGVLLSPTYFYNSTVNYDNFNENQFNIGYGLNIEYQINKFFTISLRSTYFKRYLSSNCVDTNSYSGKNAISGSPYYVSKGKCNFTTKNTYAFIEFPLCIKYYLGSNSKWKPKKYILLGNNFMYLLSRKDAVTNITTRETKEYKGYTSRFFSLFSPMIAGGYEVTLKNELLLFSEMYLKTEKPLFSNFSLGLNFGIKTHL